MRRRNTNRQIFLLFGIGLGLFLFVGGLASWLDTSSPAERACIVKKGHEDFRRCVWDARHK